MLAKAIMTSITMNPGSPRLKNSNVPKEHPSGGSLSQTPTSFGQLSDTSINTFCYKQRIKNAKNKRLKIQKTSESTSSNTEDESGSLTFGDFKEGDFELLEHMLKECGITVPPSEWVKPASKTAVPKIKKRVTFELDDNGWRKIRNSTPSSASGSPSSSPIPVSSGYSALIDELDNVNTPTDDSDSLEHSESSSTSSTPGSTPQDSGDESEAITPVVVVPLDVAEDPFKRVVTYLTKEIHRYYTYHELLLGKFDTELWYHNVSVHVDMEDVSYDQYLKYIWLVRLDWETLITNPYYQLLRNASDYYKDHKTNIHELLVETLNGGKNFSCYVSNFSGSNMRLDENKQLKYPKIIIDKYVLGNGKFVTRLAADPMIVVLRAHLNLADENSYGAWWNKYVMNRALDAHNQTEIGHNTRDNWTESSIPTETSSCQTMTDMDIQCDLGHKHEYKKRSVDNHYGPFDVPRRKNHRFVDVSQKKGVKDQSRWVNFNSELLYTLKTKYFMSSRSPAIINQMVADARSFVSKNDLSYDREVYRTITNTIMQAYILDEQELLFRSMIKNNDVLDGTAHLNDTMAGNMGKSFRGFHKHSLLGHFLGSKHFPKVVGSSL